MSKAAINELKGNEDQQPLLALVERIRAFLSKFSRSNGPDPGELSCAADAIHLIATGQAKKPLDTGIKYALTPHSEWGSGCYHPYDSEEGKAEHAAILVAIKELKAKFI